MNCQYCFGLSASILLLPAERKVWSFYLLFFLLLLFILYFLDDIMIRAMLTQGCILNVIIQNPYYSQGQLVWRFFGF